MRISRASGYLSIMLTLCSCEAKNDAASSPPSATKVEAAETPAALQARAKQIFASLPEHMQSAKHPLSPARIELGHMLYFDTRLSRGQELSCASCHDLNGYGIDTRPDAIERGRSFGHRKQLGERNSPSTYNAALHVAQFWDRRAADVEEQAGGPILNPVEMTMASAESVVAVLDSMPGYAPLFAAAFPEAKPAMTYETMARAISAYERTLVTPSRFDAFLEGDASALGPKEQAGLRAFVDLQGPLASQTSPRPLRTSTMGRSRRCPRPFA
jgi:cytochrome c peroxidase